jgi:hypothetical protein
LNANALACALLLLLLLLLMLLLIALLVRSCATVMAGVISIVLQPSGRPGSFRWTFCISFTLLLAVLSKFPASARPLLLRLL